jgi:hypothetical protein
LGENSEELVKNLLPKLALKKTIEEIAVKRPS